MRGLRHFFLFSLTLSALWGGVGGVHAQSPTPAPAPTATPLPAPTATPVPQGVFRRGQVPANYPGWTIYTVVRGDTLYNISLRFNADYNLIVSANAISNQNIIYSGEALLIPPAGATLPTPAPVVSATPPANVGGPLPTPLGAVHRPAPNTIPSLVVPTFARPGAQITITGSNYPGNSQIAIYVEKKSLDLASAQITTVTAAPDGTFTATFTIPTTWLNGTPINQSTVSVSAYALGTPYWAMNFFTNR